MAIQRVCLTIGSGSMESGFEVTVRIGQAGHMPTTEIHGQLPGSPGFLRIFSQWQACQRPWQVASPQRGITVHATQRTNASYQDAYQAVEAHFNQWLQSPDREWQLIRDRLQQLLDPADEIQVILQTDHPQLRQFPWSAWRLFTQDYPYAEIALGSSDYQRIHAVSPQSNTIRVLLVLGQGQFLNLESDEIILKGLGTYGADSPQILYQPTPTRLREVLRAPQGWHVFCYAGHSNSNEDGTLGSLQLQADQAMSLAELKLAMQKAIAQGLQLAIFNSCDGLGLARQLSALNLPQSIVMREAIPDQVAPQFLEKFLLTYAQGQGLFLALRDAREYLKEEWHSQYPGVEWLPVLSQNPALLSPTWHDLGGMARAYPPCPYVGLAAFQETDAACFFGREAMIDQVREQLEQQMLVTLYGASGCGKSSLVFAGVLPHYRQQYQNKIHVATLKPGSFPCEALASAILAWDTAPEQSIDQNIVQDIAQDTVQDDPAYNALKVGLQFEQNPETLKTYLYDVIAINPEHRYLIIVDQLEELFTLTLDPVQRSTFLANLSQALYAVPNLRVLVTLRPEFLGDLQHHEAWNQLLQACQPTLLGPMTSPELEAAIAQPATVQGVVFAPGLVKRLQDEMRGQPQRLPLLEFALTQLWEHMSEERCLTHAAFQAIGGLDKALANYAETCFAQLSESDRNRAEQILTQLVIPGEDYPTTRRRASLADIPDDDRALVTKLADQRLLVTTAASPQVSGTVELIHEALIDHWPLFKVWIARDREFRLWQEQMRAQYRLWQKTAQSPDSLLSGTLLHQAQTWQREKSSVMGEAEQAFIRLSLDQRDRHKQASEQTKRKQKRLRLLAGITGMSALIIGGIALWQWQASTEQQLIRQALQGTLSPPKYPQLAQILEQRLTQTQAPLENLEHLDSRLLQFRQILRVSQKILSQLASESQNSQQSQKRSMGDRYEHLQQESSQGLLTLLMQHRFPRLKHQLQQRQLGVILDATPDQLAEQFSPGALQTTYELLLRPIGFHADVNDDGLIDHSDEAMLIPCEAIALIERFWRQYTQNRCGWYGSHSAFEESECTELQFTTQDLQLDETTGDMKTITTQQGGTLLQALIPFPQDALMAHIHQCDILAQPISEESSNVPSL